MAVDGVAVGDSIDRTGQRFIDGRFNLLSVLEIEVHVGGDRKIEAPPVDTSIKVIVAPVDEFHLGIREYRGRRYVFLPHQELSGSGQYCFQLSLNKGDTRVDMSRHR